jgi:SAM-dependent methyltransferase
MPLAYYSRAATAAFWSEHWGRQSVDGLLGVARASPLTGLIVRALPAEGFVFEGGCGLGQYVVLLRALGVSALGADQALAALRECRRVHRDAPLSAMDLRQLAVRSGILSAYISLGVVEHDPAGPDGIVSEAARGLRPGGVLLLSVPYWNGVRRLFAPYLVLRNRRVRASGGQFYQFAFTLKEVAAFLAANGFAVRSFHPYDPARIFRRAARRLMDRRGWGLDRGSVVESGAARPAGQSPHSAALRLKSVLRRLLYTPWVLGLFGHMLLVVAVKR